VSLPPPTNEDIEDIISTMKKSKTPGDDGIQMELISLPVNGFNILLQILQKTWIKNQVLIEWIKTTQIPIPKIRKPKKLTVTDEYHFAAPHTKSIQNGCSSSQTCPMNFHPH
jgi:hypothetical protein